MDRDTKLNLATGAIIFALVCLWAFFSSCTTQRKVEKWNAKHPVKAASYCARTFPPIEWTEYVRDTLTDTVTVTEPLYVFDTLYVEGDTVVMKTKCPPSKVITRTIRDTVRTRVRDSAAVYALQGTLRAAEDLIQADKKLIDSQNNLIAKGRGLVLKMGLIIILLLLWIFRKPILNLLNPIKKIYPF